MSKGILSKVIACSAITAMFVSCVKMGDIYEGTPQEQKDAKSGSDYAAQFSNYSEITANITSKYENGRFYAIYASNPYGEDGDIVGQPLLRGITPINEKISMPNGTGSLFVLNDDGLAEYGAENFVNGVLTITDDNAKKTVTRAADSNSMTSEQLDVAIRRINNELLIEQWANVKSTNLYKCTDLYIQNLPEGETADVWITPITKENNVGKMWYYTYKKQNPEVADCTFYGLKDGQFVQVSLGDIQKGTNPLVKATGDAYMQEMKLASEQFTNGTYVGFVYTFDLGPHFTTPVLNTKENGSYTDANSKGDYIGQRLTYSADDMFEITQPINSGIILHFDCLGKYYNVVGMERRLPNQDVSYYDGDYNDMMLLVRTNPETIKPKEEIDRNPLVTTTFRQGLWLFEDNYPNEGDFDFNDVVLAYDISKKGNLMDVKCKIVAKGCNFHNKVGVMVLPNTSKDAWKTPSTKEELWDDVCGYFNVYENSTLDFFTNCPVKTVRVTCSDFNLLRPYLDNGNGRTCNFPWIA